MHLFAVVETNIHLQIILFNGHRVHHLRYASGVGKNILLVVFFFTVHPEFISAGNSFQKRGNECNPYQTQPTTQVSPTYLTHQPHRNKWSPTYLTNSTHHPGNK